jgi:hypothetical protein
MGEEDKVEAILDSNKDALSKVRELVKLGMEEEQADYVVGQRQMGQDLPVYYERLDFDDTTRF